MRPAIRRLVYHVPPSRYRAVTPILATKRSADIRRRAPLWRVLAASIAALTASTGAGPTWAESAPASRTGEEVYEFYCYQCHGYDGRARTRAASSVDPPPRDFTAADPASLTRDSMIDAVRDGRAGTAMAAFDRVLSEGEIEAVVDYVRDRFMDSPRTRGRYHTAANDWPEHEQRYGAAFPFVTGELSLDTPVEELSARERRGLKMYFDGCVTCHDQPFNAGSQGPHWDLRPVSYPRGDYTDHALDAGSSAREETASLSETGRAGRQLFQENCELCHGADGTGRNWIGAFLEPKATNLRRAVPGRSRAQLRQLVRNGIEDTSMPAWRHVLTREQTNSLVTYLQEAFGASSGD